MNRRLIGALIGVPLLLTACTSADTEQMRTGLGKAGLNQTQAACYSEAMAKAVSAKFYNAFAGHLVQGADIKEATQRTRRKFGTDFSDQMSEAKQALETCLR